MSRIAWLIPGLLEGSGGHRTFLQHADVLQQRGHHCTLYVENPQGAAVASLRRDIQRYFGFFFDDVRSGWADVEPAELVFATIWYSARAVRDLSFPCVKAYFVQDFEAKFNPVGDAYLMAENSYRYGLYPVAIGRWLPAMLTQRFAIPASCFEFCADLAVYRRLPEIEREMAVCFIFQPEKSRRCPQLGLEALGIVKHYMPHVKIYLFGSRVPGHVWFDHENLGLLDLEACNRLYNRCQVGLCISATNPSRIPFEMMAAGLPVVEVHRDNTVHDFPEAAMLLCEQTPESLARGILELLADAKRLERMGKAGEAFMASRPLERGLDQFVEISESLIEGETPRQAPTEIMYGSRPCVGAPIPPEMVHGEPGRPLPDSGRLAFLPPRPRRAARFVYYHLRRWLN